jgi:hypothetical protein
MTGGNGSGPSMNCWKASEAGVNTGNVVRPWSNPAARRPPSRNPVWSFELLRHQMWVDENPRTKDAAHDDHRGVEQPRATGQLRIPPNFDISAGSRPPRPEWAEERGLPNAGWDQHEAPATLLERKTKWLSIAKSCTWIRDGYVQVVGLITPLRCLAWWSATMIRFLNNTHSINELRYS